MRSASTPSCTHSTPSTLQGHAERARSATTKLQRQLEELSRENENKDAELRSLQRRIRDREGDDERAKDQVGTLQGELDALIRYVVSESECRVGGTHAGRERNEKDARISILETKVAHMEARVNGAKRSADERVGSVQRKYA